MRRFGAQQDDIRTDLPGPCISTARHLSVPLPTLAAQLHLRNGTEFDKRADIQTEMSTCGYQDGDPNKFRTANPGFDCRVDTMNGLWGFCPVTVIAATDCGLAGSCVDHGSCSRGCGKTANAKLTTFTCGPKQFCSTALLTFGVDQTYSYIGCGGSPRTDHYLITPTANSAPTSSTSKTTPTTNLSSSPTPTASSSSPRSTDASSGTTPTTNAAPTNESDSGSRSTNNGGSSPNNTGAIVGGVIGGIALLCISGLVAILLLRRNRPHGRQTPTKGAQRDTHQSWYDRSPKTKHRFTGGWGPRELDGSQQERYPDHPIELPS
ncbi:hypothetical protein TgHK011_009420 [Trichoderma gracile]|nr:hypothetical protein TgHK011_009420 [Trichoderma gracile]